MGLFFQLAADFLVCSFTSLSLHIESGDSVHTNILKLIKTNVDGFGSGRIGRETEREEGKERRLLWVKEERWLITINDDY